MTVIETGWQHLLLIFDAFIDWFSVWLHLLKNICQPTDTFIYHYIYMAKWGAGGGNIKYLYSSCSQFTSKSISSCLVNVKAMNPNLYCQQQNLFNLCERRHAPNRCACVCDCHSVWLCECVCYPLQTLCDLGKCSMMGSCHCWRNIVHKNWINA